MRDPTRPFLVIGHRGAPAVAVENTLAAFEHALSQGANGLEVDLCLTRDGHVVVWHDWEPSSAIALARQAGAEPNVMARPVVPSLASTFRRPVDELTLAELRAHHGYAIDGERVEVSIPTLDELLGWSTGARSLRCVLFDLKLPASKADLTEALVGAVTRKVAEHRVSFEHVLLTPHPSIYDRASPLVAGDALSFDVDPEIVLVDTMGRKDASSARAVARGSGHASTVMPKGIPSQAWSALARLVRSRGRHREGAPSRLREALGPAPEGAPRRVPKGRRGRRARRPGSAVPASLRTRRGGRGRRGAKRGFDRDTRVRGVRGRRQRSGSPSRAPSFRTARGRACPRPTASASASPRR